MPPTVRVNPRGFRFAIDTEFSGTLVNANTVSEVQLQADAAGGGTQANDYFNGWGWINFKSGACAGLQRRIVYFVGATDKLGVYPPLPVAPGADTYSIVMVLRPDVLIGVATAGGADSITLPVAAGIRDDFWTDCKVDLVGGKGGSVSRPVNMRTVRNYVGSSKVLSVDRPWDLCYGGQPDSTTEFRLHGHLYRPVSSFEAKEETDKDLIWSSQPAGIGNGVGITGPGPDHSGLASSDDYMEIALAGVAGTATGVLLSSRWE